MIITALRQTTSEHVTLCFAGGEELKSTLGVVTDLRLFAGRELDDGELERLRQESDRALAREKALSLLAQRQMSAKELARKLREKGIQPETAEFCVAWVQEHGLLDEESYSAAVVRHYTARGYGEGRVRQELMRRGLPRELWEEALAALPRELGDEKLDRYISAHLRDPEDRDAVRRLSASLYRRGYGRTEIREALERFHAEAADFEE